MDVDRQALLNAKTRLAIATLLTGVVDLLGAVRELALAAGHEDPDSPIQQRINATMDKIEAVLELLDPEKP